MTKKDDHHPPQRQATEFYPNNSSHLEEVRRTQWYGTRERSESNGSTRAAFLPATYQTSSTLANARYEGNSKQGNSMIDADSSMNPGEDVDAIISNQDKSSRCTKNKGKIPTQYPSLHVTLTSASSQDCELGGNNTLSERDSNCEIVNDRNNKLTNILGTINNTTMDYKTCLKEKNLSQKPNDKSIESNDRPIYHISNESENTNFNTHNTDILNRSNVFSDRLTSQTRSSVGGRDTKDTQRCPTVPSKFFDITFKDETHHNFSSYEENKNEQDCDPNNIVNEKVCQKEKSYNENSIAGTMYRKSYLTDIDTPQLHNLSDVEHLHNYTRYRRIKDSIIHKLFYDPDNPEFTSLQQNSWAVVLGVFMGVFTAKWAELIELCVEVVWKIIPEKLLIWGVFTDLDGHFPLPHYMWVCPAVLGGILSYVSASLKKPIPDQNEWIESLHRVGVIDHSSFVQLILISTVGMASGLSLGPELPLILSSGMIGSYLGIKTKQSILSARVMNLTAAGAAIGGFFGFPMAGAMFVLELPHRMGLQYFEALSPSTLSSIFAVLVNRMVTGNDVSGYFRYPFLTATLPSHIFYVAIIYGIVGSILGVIYTKGCLFLKRMVHQWFHAPRHGCINNSRSINYRISLHSSEKTPLVGDENLKSMKLSYDQARSKFCIKHEPTRAAVAGILVGFLVGVTCMFIPHSMFWGEAQLQTLIDKGSTPLPIFGKSGDPTAILTAYGYCLIDPDDEIAKTEGFGLGCAGLMVITKIFVVGLSLGTGIPGGHFWAPLYVGCAASHFFTEIVSKFNRRFGFGKVLSMYPCVSVLCIMGSTHIVTYRAHLAIMLILTLTIKAFSAESGNSSVYDSSGDYSAIFPLLVVASFIPLMFTRSIIFYKKQRCRGDIIASPEVLCEPRKEGTPEYPIRNDIEYESDFSGDNGSSYEIDYQNEEQEDPSIVSVGKLGDFEDLKKSERVETTAGTLSDTSSGSLPKFSGRPVSLSSGPNVSSLHLVETYQRPTAQSYRQVKSGNEDQNSTSGFSNSSATQSVQQNSSKKRAMYARSNSIERHVRDNSIERSIQPPSPRDNNSHGKKLTRVNSFGEIYDFQPSLMHQARQRVSTASHYSNQSNSSKKKCHGKANLSSSIPDAVSLEDQVQFIGELTSEDAERTFSSITNMSHSPPASNSIQR